MKLTSAKARDLAVTMIFVVVAVGVGFAVGEIRRRSAASDDTAQASSNRVPTVLSPADAALLLPSAAQAPGSYRIVLLVRARDIDTCDELGLQIRALSRRLAEGVRLEVWSPLADSAALHDFLRAERIIARLAGFSMKAIVENTRAPESPTPAVILVGRKGEAALGIAHTESVTESASGGLVPLLHATLDSVRATNHGSASEATDNHSGSRWLRRPTRQ